MLDFLRRSSKSFFAWVILGLLGLAFGLSFGLPSDSLTFGPTPLVKVHGDTIGDDEYNFQLRLMQRTFPLNNKDPRFRKMLGYKEEILEASIERDLLAYIADDIGLSATTKDAEDLIANGHLIALGDTFDWLSADMDFNYEIFTKNHLRSLQVSENNYIEFQRREILARTLRDVLEASAIVADGELREAYNDEANKLSLRYARYEPARFAETVDLTPDEVDAYVAAHTDELKSQFAAQGSRFTKLPKQARLSVIEIKKPPPEDPSDDAEPDAEGAGDAEKRASPEDRLKALRARLAAARKKIEDGEDFRPIARALSEHESAPRGGDFGWLSVKSGSGLDPVVDELLPTLEVDAVSEILDGESSLFLIRISGRREGDVEETDGLRELAEEGAKQERGTTLAREAAAADLAAVKAGATVSDVFKPLIGELGEEGGIEDIPFGDAPPPRLKVELRETGLFAKTAPVPGLGPMPDLVEAAWTASTDQPLLDQVYEAGGSVVLAGLDRKEEGTDEGFAEARTDLYDRLSVDKGRRVSSFWANRQCLEAKGRGDIVASEGKIGRLVTYDIPEKEGEAPVPTRRYNVCDRVGKRGGLLRAAAFGQGLGGGQ